MTLLYGVLREMVFGHLGVAHGQPAVGIFTTLGQSQMFEITNTHIGYWKDSNKCWYPVIDAFVGSTMEYCAAIFEEHIERLRYADLHGSNT